MDLDRTLQYNIQATIYIKILYKSLSGRSRVWAASKYINIYLAFPSENIIESSTGTRIKL